MKNAQRTLRVRSLLGGALLAALTLSAGAASAGDAAPAPSKPEPPQYAKDHAAAVTALMAEARRLDGICDLKADSPSMLEKRKLVQTKIQKTIDELLAAPRKDTAWRDGVASALRDAGLKFLADPGIGKADPDKVVSWLKVDLKPNVKNGEFAVGEFRDVCDDLCTTSSALPLCVMGKDPVVANAIVAADASNVTKVLTYVKTNWDQTTATIEVNVRSLDGTRLEAGFPEQGEPPAPSADGFLGAGIATLLGAGPAGGAAVLAAPYIDIALQGLAKLIADRAKLEAVGFVLDGVGSDVCGAGSNPPSLAQRDISKYWMPSLCNLATAEQPLSTYGAGEDLLNALKVGLVRDARGLPGALGGLALGTLFLHEALPSDPKIKTPFDCNTVEGTVLVGAQKVACTKTEAVRLAAGRRLTTLLDGENPLGVFGQLGADLGEINRDPGAASFHGNATQIMACAMSLPDAFERNHRLFQQSLPHPQDRAHAAALAALAAAPACWTIFGHGISTEWKAFGSSGATPEWKTALASPHKTERMTTLRRLDAEIGDRVLDLATSWTRLEQAVSAYVEVVQKPQAAPKKPNADASDADKRASELQAQREHVKAALVVASASLGFGRAGIALLRGTNKQCVLPGLIPPPAGAPNCDPVLTTELAKTLDLVDESWKSVELQIAALLDVFDQNWSSVTANLLASLQVSNTGIDADDKRWQEVRNAIASRAPALIAILNAKNGEDMARALDAVAAPPGGWRTKGKPGKVTFSVVSHPGLLGGVEWRYGPYGAVKEGGWPPYGIAPALAMPVGVEVAWGIDCAISPIGLFVSALDPAAYLQYDASKDGRLPGASVKTALAPGLGLRLGIKDTPFSIIPNLTYRPGLRQWQPAAGGTGADALQFSVLLGVDVTLFQTSIGK